MGAAGLSYSSGSAAWSFFVPILNLFRPYQVGAETWRASDPSFHPLDRHCWQSAPAGVVVGLWWAGFLVPYLLDSTCFRSPSWDGPPDALRNQSFMLAGLQRLWATGALLAVWYVRSLDRRQTARLATVRSFLEGREDRAAPSPRG